MDDVGAQVVDADLQNPWGLADGPATPLWVADNATDVATIYPGDVNGSAVTKAPLVVEIPGGAPTGQVFNPTSDFVAAAAQPAGPARFVFATENGGIVAWNPATPPAAQATTAEVEYSDPAAVYKGLAIAATLDGSFLYATNFSDATVDVFDGTFQKVTSPGGFVDDSLPAGYAPFGIQNIHGLIYVTYALQDDERRDDVSGPGHGYVDAYTTDGYLLGRVASGGDLNSPWGMTIAPEGFGDLAGQLLIGNFGDGRINAFDPKHGRFEGALREGKHGPRITIDGLWALEFGNGTIGTPQTLLFTAGPGDESHGLFGTITAAKRGH
jgi:uncharacterized protein (TIGR03118 family)